MSATASRPEAGPGYSRFARLLHWLTVLLIAAVFGLTYFWDGPYHHVLLTLHRSFGITILILTIIRLGHWLVVPHPEPVPMPALQRMAARGTHFLLYAALLVQPALGWADSLLRNRPVDYFFLIRLPPFLPTDKALADTLIDIHGELPNFILALIGLHVAAALFHHVVIKDRTLKRMISG